MYRTMTRGLRRLPLVLAATLSFGGCAKSTPAAETNAGKTFLAQNAKAADIHSTPSGLQYRILKSGPETGAHPTGDGEVKVNYEGKLIDGTVFDSSYARHQPAVFPLDRVIPGWTEGVQLMTPGSKYRFVIPPELGYGARGEPGAIPPTAVLLFDIELLAVRGKP